MTILLKRGEGDPDRVAHAVSCVRPSPLWEVADAVVAYSSTYGEPVYVERVEDDLYRWSPAHRGGMYPLARVLARFLKCDHHDITIGFVTVEGGWAVVGDPGRAPANDHAVFETPITTLEGAEEMILAALGDD
jgi:hypothetical protein